MEKKLYEQMTELVNWLNDECPAVAPPIEPYTTTDLSHNFAEGLRIRLDEIDILRSALANKLYTAVSGSLPLASADKIMERIVPKYRDANPHDRAVIAGICDEVLDQSGRFLGEVRTCAMASNER